MSLANFGEEALPRTGRAQFDIPASSVQNTIYGGENARFETQQTITNGGRARVAGHGDGAVASPFAAEAVAPPRPFATSPRLHKNKNSKFDMGCIKVGAGGFDAQRSRRDYETSRAAAAQTKAKQLGGAGSFLSHEA